MKDEDQTEAKPLTAVEMQRGVMQALHSVKIFLRRKYYRLVMDILIILGAICRGLEQERLEDKLLDIFCNYEDKLV